LPGGIEGAALTAACPGSATNAYGYVDRHSSKLVNFAFCDGHAKSLAYDQLYNTKGPTGNPMYLCVGGG
jgi:prepilin-type processing-associated H-X9-DG protein